MAAVGYGYGMILVRRLSGPKGISPLVVSVVQAVLGIGWAALVIPFTGWGPLPQWSIGVVLGVTFLGLSSTALAFTLFVRMVRDEGPVRAGTVLFLIPVVVVGSFALLGTAPTPVQLAGVAVVLAGLLLARLSRSTPGEGNIQV